MKNQEEAILQKTLNLDFTEQDSIGVSSLTTAQRTIGIISMLLPVLLVALVAAPELAAFGQRRGAGIGEEGVGVQGRPACCRGGPFRAQMRNSKVADRPSASDS